MVTIHTPKTYSLNPVGTPSLGLDIAQRPELIAIKPSVISYIKPKLMVKKGESVSIGSPLFFDKTNAHVQFLSPGAGIVVDIVYGPKRVLEQIVIQLNETEESIPFDASQSILKSDPADILRKMCEGGVLSYFKVLPFNTTPNQNDNPNAIVVSIDDDEPFKPQASVYLKGREDLFKQGVALLSQLCSTVIVSASTKNDYAKSSLSNEVTHFVSGEYPANQAATVIYSVKTSPDLNNAWTIGAQDLLLLTDLLMNGVYPTQKIIVIAGTSVSAPKHLKVRIGSPISSIVGDETSDRIIAGGYFNGRTTSYNDYLGLFDDAIQIMPNGLESEFLGFVSPGLNKPSYSKTFLSALTPSKLWNYTSSLNGSPRSCISCTKCVEVCPVDLTPQFLMKDIKSGEIEDAVSQGFLDCTECGLCTYVCPSKIELDTMFRDAKMELKKEIG